MWLPPRNGESSAHLECPCESLAPAIVGGQHEQEVIHRSRDVVVGARLGDTGKPLRQRLPRIFRQIRENPSGEGGKDCCLKNVTCSARTVFKVSQN